MVSAAVIARITASQTLRPRFEPLTSESPAGNLEPSAFMLRVNLGQSGTCFAHIAASTRQGSPKRALRDEGRRLCAKVSARRPGALRCPIARSASGVARRIVAGRGARTPRDVRALAMALGVQSAELVERRNLGILRDPCVPAAEHDAPLTKGELEQHARWTELALRTKRLTNFAAILHGSLGFPNCLPRAKFWAGPWKRWQRRNHVAAT